MKKTLLSLVLAGLATTAFAGEVYNYESASSKASVELNTEAGFNYSANRVFFDSYGVEKLGGPFVADSNIRQRQDIQVFSPYANFTIYGEAEDLERGFKFGFVSNIDSSYTYEKKRGFASNTPLQYVKLTDHLMSSPVVREIAFTFGSDTMGYFRVGKTSTAANAAFAPMNAHVNNSFVSVPNLFLPKTALTAALAFDEVIAYEAPVWNGLSAAISFAKEHQAKYEFTNQVAGNVRFRAYDAKVALVAYRNLYKADHHSQSVTKGLSLSAGYNIYDTDLVFGAGYESTHQKQHPTDWSLESPRANDIQLDKSYSFGLEASYNGFQYAKPYLGVYYVKNVKKNFIRTFKIDTKTFSGSLGVGSDVYKKDNIIVNIYAETGFARTSAVTRGREKPTDNYNAFVKTAAETFYFGTGLNVSF